VSVLWRVVEFRILGPLEVLGDDGRPVALPPAKPRALLVLLLLNRNRTVRTDMLVDQLWDERPPATATKTVQVYVSQLRKGLGDRLQTRPGGYELRVGDGELDADRFERLAGEGEYRDALELWRGPALDDVRGEAFARSAAERLEEARLAALEDRIDADLDAGRHAVLVGELEQLVEEHPLRERLRGQLMLALYRSGRQAEALDVYRRTRTLLADELGLEPSPELRELEQAILRQDQALRRERPAATAAAPTSPIRRRVWPLVALGLLLLAAIAGLGAYLALRGDGGAGAKETTAAPDTKAFVVKVENLLEQAHEGRLAVRAAVQAAVRCEVPLREAAGNIEDVRANRQSLLQQVTALPVPDDPEAQRTVTLLHRALAAAFAADLGYRRDILRATSCPPKLRTGPGERSHRLKAAFVAAFNPLARRYGLETWSADAI
jgi:DNA-binding SARP family transcriptional activator